MRYAYASLMMIAVAMSCILVRADGPQTRRDACAESPTGSIVTLMDCPPRLATRLSPY